MKQTELDKAIEALVNAAQAHSFAMLGEDAVDLPADWSLMPPDQIVQAVAAYLENIA